MMCLLFEMLSSLLNVISLINMSSNCLRRDSATNVSPGVLSLFPKSITAFCNVWPCDL